MRAHVALEMLRPTDTHARGYVTTYATIGGVAGHSELGANGTLPGKKTTRLPNAALMMATHKMQQSVAERQETAASEDGASTKRSKKKMKMKKPPRGMRKTISGGRAKDRVAQWVASHYKRGPFPFCGGSRGK